MTPAEHRARAEALLDEWYEKYPGGIGEGDRTWLIVAQIHATLASAPPAVPTPSGAVPPPGSTELLSLAEASAMTGIAEATLRYWRHLGSGPPSFKLGRGVKYRRSAVIEWMAEEERLAEGRRQ